MMDVGITVKKTIGIGDSLQYSSLPENYFRTTGKLLPVLTDNWFFDHNPYVDRVSKPEKVIEMWNTKPEQEPRPTVYLCNAERHAAVLGVNVFLNRPRLYKYEEYPYRDREKILLHIDGKSNGRMPDHVIEHILKKYKEMPLFTVGQSDEDFGVPKISTPTLWELAREISEARMFIGMDSGPNWIAACYPDVVLKRLRTKPAVIGASTWVPLTVDNIHSHWDDRCAQIFTPLEDDAGFMTSYKRI